MFKNKQFWKGLAAFVRYTVVMLVLAGSTAGCNKMEKIKNKCVLLEFDIKQKEALRKELQQKRKDITEAQKDDPNGPAVQSLKTDIAQEEEALQKVHENNLEALDDFHDERLKLKDFTFEDLEAFLKWLAENCPNVIKLLSDAELLENTLTDGLTQKQTAQDAIVYEQDAIIASWGNYSPPMNDIIRMHELNAQLYPLSLHDEVVTIHELVELFSSVGPLPVPACSVCDMNCSYYIEEGFPERLEHLNDGLLAPGTEIIIQLPADWKLTAPAVIDSNTLTLDVMGNEPNSNIIWIEVLTESIPDDPNDKIQVTFQGVEIGRRTGVVSAVTTVVPGRSSKQDFVVVPPNCEAGLPARSDINLDGIVNFEDFSTMANEWLLDVGSCP
ncbi:MAG: hypothetical protein JW806_04925 [Sedimentisphaerales bacterium]|nr:hypothetical protein [Sedimentisphaerales bacterium]